MIVFVVCSSLRDVTIDAVSALSNSSNTLKTVEKCSCPRGYQGLSCEVRQQQVLVSRYWSADIGQCIQEIWKILRRMIIFFQLCESGYRRVGNQLYGGMCLPCNCNNHAERCDINTGKCIVSLPHTVLGYIRNWWIFISFDIG